MSQPRDDLFYFYPGESVWCDPFPGGDYHWLQDGAALLDARAGFYFYATGNAPAIAKKIIGKGPKYAFAFNDSDGKPFDGAKSYRVHVPANAPAREFWAFTLYDHQTRSMLQTDARFPGIDSKSPALVANDDGSYDVYFGPDAPAGNEGNWVQTVPGKGWNVLFRLYGPLEPWFEKTWRPGEPKLASRVPAHQPADALRCCLCYDASTSLGDGTHRWGGIIRVLLEQLTVSCATVPPPDR